MIGHAEDLRQFRRDNEYYEAHYEGFVKSYPDQWVAIFDQQVVGAGPDPDRLIHDLKEKGVPIGMVVVKYLTTKDEVWILSV